MPNEMHLSLVIYSTGSSWTWNLIDRIGESGQRTITMGALNYDTFEACAKELNKISADFLPETDVYKVVYREREFVGPLEMFSELEGTK